MKHYFVIENVYDRDSGEAYSETWIFSSSIDNGSPINDWINESLKADPMGRLNASGRSYDTTERTYCVNVIKVITQAEYNFLKEIGVKVMT